MKDNQLIKYAMESVLAIHGLGLVGGIYFVFTKESWFSKVLGNPKLAAAIAAIFWLIGGIALVATAWALFKNLEWQKSAAIVGLIVSTVGVVLWGDAVPGGAIFGQVLSALIIAYLLLVK